MMDKWGVHHDIPGKIHDPPAELLGDRDAKRMTDEHTTGKFHDEITLLMEFTETGEEDGNEAARTRMDWNFTSHIIETFT